MALIAGAALAAAVVVVVLVRPEGLKEGPVYAGGGRDISAQPIDVVVEYSFGYVLRNESKRPAEVETVRVVGVTGPVEVLGLMARLRPGADAPQPSEFMMSFGYPPPEFPSKPIAEEHVVPVGKTFTAGGTPYEGLQLVVGMRIKEPGVGGIRGVEYTYRIGQRRYRNFFDGSGYLCAPRAEYRSGGAKDGQCPGEAVEDRFDKKFVEFRVPAKSESSARRS